MTVPDAIQVAKKHLTTVLPVDAKAHLYLEELQMALFRLEWSFTFSAVRPASTCNSAANPAEVLRGRRVSKAVAFGLTDAAIHGVRMDTLILTEDSPVSGFLRTRSIAVLNFNDRILMAKQR